MTDDKKKSDEMEGIDWDSALEEWESKTFVPEVAKDTTTDKPAVLAGNAPKPLYRPPPPAAGVPPSAPGGPQSPRSQKPTLPDYSASDDDYVPDEDDDGSGATVIAAIPRELLRGAGKAEDAGPKSVGGGLGQLFSKTGEHRATEGGQEGIDVDVAEQPIGKVTSRPPPMTATNEEGDPSVITSAKHLGMAIKEKAAEPLRRPSQVDPGELVREGEMFDPFEEPDTAIREAKPQGPPGIPRPKASAAQPAPRVRPPPPPQRPIALTPAVDLAERDPFAAPANVGSDPFAKTDATDEAPPMSVPEGESVELPSADTAAVRAATAASSTDEALDALLGGGDEDDPPSDGPALLSPNDRKYDPNEETGILNAAVREQLARPKTGAADIDLVGVGEVDDDDDDEEDDDEATRVRMRGEAPIDVLPVRRWPDEKPAAEWLDGPMRAGLLARAEWLEAEARTTPDKATRARALLAVSELRAIRGDAQEAAALALEARDLAPNVVLAHRQARALVSGSRDVDADSGDVVAALDLELKHSPSPAARVHVALLAADAQRLAGDDDGAAKRFEQALRIAPSDLRAPLLRAARALAKAETASAALRLPDAPEMRTIADAVASALRLRGVDRADPNAKKQAPMTSASQEVTQAQLPESLPNDSLRRARAALDKGDVVAAATLVAELRVVPELARGAAWLAAALGSTRIASRAEAAELLDTLAGDDGDLARRSLAARAIELGIAPLAEKAIGRDKTFSPAERAVITTLVRHDAPADEADLEALVAADGMRPLAAALSAVTPVTSGARGDASRDASIRARSARTAGTTSHGAVRLARLIASHAPDGDIEAAVASFGESAPPEARAIALELAIRGDRFGEVSDALGAWTSSSDGPDAQRDRHLAAAIVAERSGDNVRALAAYKAARTADPSAEATLRAIAALDPSTDLTIELNTLADDLGDGARGAVARLEAVARAESNEGGPALDDPTRAELLERAHRASPALPIASFLAERIARRAGDVDAVLRWVRERRAAVNDPLESGLDGVREALLVADKDPGVASERLEEAHRARPNDVALRELYERMSSEPLTDRGAWRESRAAQATGDTRALLYLEAAHEYERAGDREASLRASEAAAAASGDGLGKVARERAEVEGGQVARLADELLALAKSTEDPRERREAYERLAVLDALGRDDPASAMLWHRSILEETPLHVASLRYVEHALIGEGRDDELEPIASAIAKVLAPANDNEAASHAWLGARLRLRGATGDWEGTRDLVELAAALPEPTLWALRMMQAHARAHSDDAKFLVMTERILDRSTRPTEIAVLLVRAGEAAARLEDLPRARELFERAAMEDPGDVVTWGQLADVRQRAGDARGAAEACESLARTSVVPEHQLLAWYDAGRFWLDEVKDDDRGVIALEQTASIDVSFEDTFQRLSAQYAARKSSGELASLLERRIAKVTDPTERIGLLVEQGRVLTEVEDYPAARAAFEAALEGKPDDPGALSALADLCAREKDWEAAEQAWVRLARLLPTPDEQRAVYARLGELYAKHAPNYARAEVALKEVLKRAPDDVPTMEQLVQVYRHQNDSARAVELQQELITKATAPEDRRKRLLELSSIFESTGHDNRKAEQALETARRELPTDVIVLRALVDFYTRHKQLPAVNILLDRVSSDARRAFAAGRFVPALFEVMQTVYDLRGKKDAARIVGATLAAFEGRPAEIRGADARGLDPRLDDMIAPETLTPAFRALLARTGDALDAAAPIDLRSLKATALPPNAAQIGQLAGQIANAMGIGAIQVYVSPHVGTGCLPAGSAQAALVIGEGLLATDRTAARQFLIIRALKLVQARASTLARLPSADLAVLIGAWLQVFNPTWKPQGINANALAEMGRRVHAALPRNLDADVGMMALEVAGSLGTSGGTYGATAVAWANRAALLAVGDPNAALDAIALSQGNARGAPADAKERATWIARTAEAKDIVAFSMSDAYGELRAKLGIGS